MAESRGRGDEQGAGSRQGQQSGSKRPAARTGGVKAAPKKGTVEPKGTERPGVAPKSAPGKDGAFGAKGGKRHPRGG
jgi:hypothetical protein